LQRNQTASCHTTEKSAQYQYSSEENVLTRLVL